MAAFSRGPSLLLARHSTVCPFKLSFRLSPSLVSQSIAAQCAFSASAMQLKKATSTLPRRRDPRILDVEAQLEQMKQRQQRLQDMKRQPREKPAAPPPPPPPPPPPLDTAGDQQPNLLPSLRQDLSLDQHSQEKQPMSSTLLSPNEASRQNKNTFEQEAARILEQGEPVLLYAGPAKRWRLGVAAALLAACGGSLFPGLLYGYAIQLAEANVPWPLTVVLAATFAFSAFSLWQALRRRALMVRSITLLPRRVSETRIFELEIKGSGWLPGSKHSVIVPIWEVSVDRPMQQAFRPPKPEELDLRTTFNAFRPFIWLWQSIKGIGREIKYVIYANPFYLNRTVLLDLKTDPEARFSSWLVDSRARAMLGGPQGFDYFIRSRSEFTEEDDDY